MVGGRVDDLLDAVDMRGKRSDNDLTALGLAEHLIQNRTNLALRRDETGNQGVRGVHHEQVDPLLAHAREGTKVRQASVQGQLIHLEITRDQDIAGPGAHEHGERVGNRVRDGDELEVEGPHIHAFPFRDHGEARVAQAVLTQLGGNEGKGQVGAVQGDVASQREQVGNGADMVLVAVRQHHADDVIHAILDPREIGKDQVNTRLTLLGEEDAAVHDQELAPVLQNVHVAPDLAEASQRDDSQSALFQGRGFGEVFVQRLHDASLPRRGLFPIIGTHRWRVAPLTLGASTLPAWGRGRSAASRSYPSGTHRSPARRRARRKADT